MYETWFCKHIFLSIVVVGVFFCVQVTSTVVPEGNVFTMMPADAEYVTGELLVRFSPKTSGERLSTAEKKQILDSFCDATIKRNYTLKFVYCMSHFCQYSILLTSLAKYEKHVKFFKVLFQTSHHILLSLKS